MGAATKLTIRGRKPEEIYAFSKMMFGGRVQKQVIRYYFIATNPSLKGEAEK